MCRKMHFIFSLIIFVVFSFSVHNSVFADTKDRPLTMEECYLQMGYTSVEDAVKKFENHYKKRVVLPAREPAIPFTHRYGLLRINKENEMNSTLNIQFLHEKVFGYHYIMEVRPIDRRYSFNDPGQKLYTLKNGQKAIYIEHRFAFNSLYFESGDWQYRLGIDKRAADKVTPDELVKIANSVE